jgi:hypothetical protein
MVALALLLLLPQPLELMVEGAAVEVAATETMEPQEAQA